MTKENRQKDPATITAEDYLPGDLSRDRLLEQIIRVDHAGEYGAKRIYDGQLAVLGKDEIAPIIREMAKAEQKHLETFDKLIVERRVRPTILSPFWDVAGFALGAGSALLGPRAAMACTAAVEEVIEEHYKTQAEKLGNDDIGLRLTLEEFGAEETHHKEIGEKYSSTESASFEPMSKLIKKGTRLAIWLSQRI
jgi:ubiquinone biosynthesis monooxygenase Coq7